MAGRLLLGVWECGSLVVSYRNLLILPEKIKLRFSDFQKGLHGKKTIPGREIPEWIKPANHTLTLFFLREIL
jgi:hypothetical protein